MATTFQDIALTTLRMHRQNHEQPENKASGHYNGTGIKTTPAITIQRNISYRPDALSDVHPTVSKSLRHSSKKYIQ